MFSRSRLAPRGNALPKVRDGRRSPAHERKGSIVFDGRYLPLIRSCMPERRGKLFVELLAVSLLAQPVLAQQALQIDSSTIGKDGTAYITRIVPVPLTISTEAQEMLARVVPDANVAPPLEQVRLMMGKRQAELSEAA